MRQHWRRRWSESGCRGSSSARPRAISPAAILRDGFEPEVVVAIARGGLLPGGAIAYALGAKNCGALNVEFYTGIGTVLDAPEVLPPALDIDYLDGPSRAAGGRRRRQRPHARARRASCLRDARRRGALGHDLHEARLDRDTRLLVARDRRCGSTSRGRGRARSRWTARRAPREPEPVALSLAELADAGLIDAGWAAGARARRPRHRRPRRATAGRGRRRHGATCPPATTCCGRSSGRWRTSGC